MLFFIALFFYCPLVVAQTNIGDWRDHLPYNEGQKVVYTANRVYCATLSSLFYYDLHDNSINKLSKVNGLSDTRPTAIAYNNQIKALVVGYNNGNIDLVYESGNVVNLSDIKRKIMLGSKRINDIMFDGVLAYLSCDFGIVLINLQRVETADTYIIGQNAERVNVYNTVLLNNFIYAATNEGIRYAPAQGVNLSDYQNWQSLTFLPSPNAKYRHLVVFNNKLVVAKIGNIINTDKIYEINGNTYKQILKNDVWVKNMTVNNNLLTVAFVYSTDVLDTNYIEKKHLFNYGFDGMNPGSAYTSNDTVVWVADNVHGLVKVNDNWNAQKLTPNGPWSSRVGSITATDNQVWVGSGIDGIFGGYSFINEQWTSFSRQLTPEFSQQKISAVVGAAISPFNTQQVFLGTWGRGVVEMLDNRYRNIHDENNSSLQSAAGFGYTVVGALAFDVQGNLWITNQYVSRPLSVRTAQGQWHSFGLNGWAFGSTTVRRILQSSTGFRWLPLTQGGIIVHDDRQTPTNEADDRLRLLTVYDQEGKVIANEIQAIVEDQRGDIWIGTNEGVLVYYNAYSVFDTDNFSAFRVIVPQLDNDTLADYLLKSESITAFAVDGANRKWIGTAGSGAYLVSDDGTKEILHFTTDNSPLLSNTITAIAVEPKTGEVFFGTSDGMVSYRGNATTANDQFSDIRVFPNPVRPDYNGLIAISGLAWGASVKITDLAGNLVYETTAQGGEATWDGLDVAQQKVASGVYLAFCANSDGTQTAVAKIMIIR